MRTTVILTIFLFFETTLKKTVKIGDNQLFSVHISDIILYQKWRMCFSEMINIFNTHNIYVLVVWMHFHPQNFYWTLKIWFLVSKPSFMNFPTEKTLITKIIFQKIPFFQKLFLMLSVCENILVKLMVKPLKFLSAKTSLIYFLIKLRIGKRSSIRSPLTFLENVVQNGLSTERKN